MRVVDEMMALVKTYFDVARYRAYICTWLCMSEGVWVCNNNKGKQRCFCLIARNSRQPIYSNSNQMHVYCPILMSTLISISPVGLQKWT